MLSSATSPTHRAVGPARKRQMLKARRGQCGSHLVQCLGGTGQDEGPSHRASVACAHLRPALARTYQLAPTAVGQDAHQLVQQVPARLPAVVVAGVGPRAQPLHRGSHLAAERLGIAPPSVRLRHGRQNVGRLQPSGAATPTRYLLKPVLVRRPWRAGAVAVDRAVKQLLQRRHHRPKHVAMLRAVRSDQRVGMRARCTVSARSHHAANDGVLRRQTRTSASSPARWTLGRAWRAAAWPRSAGEPAA